MNVFRGDWDKRQGWGWHDMASWQTFFDLTAKIGQTATIAAADVCTNDLIAGANTFDAAKVKADAEAATLSPEMAAIDVEKIRSGMFSQAIGAAG
jgi:NitT/TauT family transport system substrate-binding protein